VLLLERHGSIAFPGATAFPGGVVDAEDADAPGAALPPTQQWAPPGEGDRPPDALAYWVAAVRELFEEVGILLAVHDGRPLAEPLGPQLGALRARVHAHEPFAQVLSSAGLVPATDRLFYFARWITPIANPRRWDTRFLVGRVPDGQEAVADGTETVSCNWMTPADALAAYQAGRTILMPPTVRTLDDLARFPSVDAVLADAARRVVRAVTPEIVQQGTRTAITYPDNTGNAAEPSRRLVLEDGRWRPSDE
jgi:8-oxo-dGTP pyrophosphatase MutT (NUDIX family)